MERPKGEAFAVPMCFILAIPSANTMAINHVRSRHMRTSNDTFTRDLFEVPVEIMPVPGALDCGRAIRHVLAGLLKAAPRSREEVAERMSELTAASISKHQLDSWTADSREGWRFPLEYVPAFEVAVETRELTTWLADLRGCKVLVGKDALDAEIGKMERMREDAGRRIRQLKNAIGTMQ